jgi:Na+/H+ antiporter NhaB
LIYALISVSITPVVVVIFTGGTVVVVFFAMYFDLCKCTVISNKLETNIVQLCITGKNDFQIGIIWVLNDLLTTSSNNNFK